MQWWSCITKIVIKLTHIYIHMHTKVFPISIQTSDCYLHLQILVSEIDFFVSGENMKDLLKLKEEEGMYPPRFCVVISCSPTARQNQARIEFRGATKELVFDTPLNPSLTSTSPTATSSCMTSTSGI